jgi:hypothetical protein
MNRINQIFVALFGASQSTTGSTPVSTARRLMERATYARGQSRYEAAELRANARALLSVMR